MAEWKSPQSRKAGWGKAPIEKLLSFLLGRGGSLSGLRFGEALLEFIHSPGGVHELLLAGVKRMADVADTHNDHGPGGAGLDDVAAGTTDFRVHIFRMNVRLHKKERKVIMNEWDDKSEVAGGYTPPIQVRSSQTALSEVRFRESRTFLAAESNLPRRKLFQASLALMATNWSTLGSR